MISTVIWNGVCQPPLLPILPYIVYDFLFCVARSKKNYCTRVSVLYGKYSNCSGSYMQHKQWAVHACRGAKNLRDLYGRPCVKHTAHHAVNNSCYLIL